MYVVIINGSGTHGKDYLIKLFEALMKAYAWVFNISMVDEVKAKCATMGCPIDLKTDEARNFWSEVNDAWHKFNRGPLNGVVKYAHDLNMAYKADSKPVILFIHCREAERIQMLKDALSPIAMVVTLLVIRDGVVPACPKNSPENIKQTVYDFEIHNTVDMEFQNEVKNFAMNLVSKGLSRYTKMQQDSCRIYEALHNTEPTEVK